MLAGHDTTATALTYALWALGHHPDFQDRVAAETAAIGDRELTPEDVPRLGYTVQVLREALRLQPPAAGVARLATRDIAVAGYRVEAGTLMAVGIYALHRDPALWPRPLDFDPDRFSAEASKGRDRWHFIPFLAGPRSCIGEHFAMLETTLAMATIIRSIEIRSVGQDFPVAVPFTTVADGCAELGARQQHRLLDRHPREDRTPQALHGLRRVGLRHHARIGQLERLAVAAHPPASSRHDVLEPVPVRPVRE